jgi:hypothetical protein
MNKNTMYLLGGVALVGLAYYLYNRNQQSSTSNTTPFANLSGSGSCTCPTCPAGFTCQQYTTRNGTKLCGCVQELTK